MKKAFLNPVHLVILAIMVLTNCVSDGDFPKMEKPAEATPMSNNFSSSSSLSSSSDVSSSSSDMSSSSSEEMSSSSGVSSSSSEQISSSSEEETCVTSNELQCCGKNEYNTTTHFCYDGSRIGIYCGSRTDVAYDPNLYECKTINSEGIYLKEDMEDDGGQKYKAVLIGEQVWMAENLNYKADGSKCYAEGVAGVSADSIAKNCDTYGRLYYWETAKTVCPNGWHLPTSDEWKELVNYVEGSSTAGMYLKATSGWSYYDISKNNYDIYGFAALPGGSGNGYVGQYGYWWGDEGDKAYAIEMDHHRDNAILGPRSNENLLFSVRCLQDDQSSEP